MLSTFSRRGIILKALLVVLVLFFSSLICYAQSQPNDRDLLVKSLEEVLRPSSLKGIRLAMGGSFSKLLEPDKKLNPDVPPEKWNQIVKEYELEVERVFSQPAGYTTLVARDISTDMTNDELREVIAFLNTEAGKKYSASGERMAKLMVSPQFQAVLAMSTLDLYSARVGLVGNKYGLKVAPLQLGR
jgi:hypothetical protein